MEIHEAASDFDRTGPGGYQPIENYGIIGDLLTTALVGMDGSIDWLCLPHHDSPSLAAILDGVKGGRFKISPVGGEVTTKQLYWPDTNVPLRASSHPTGSVRSRTTCRSVHPRRVDTDHPPRRSGAWHHDLPDGVPGLHYARQEHETRIVPGGVTFFASHLSLGLASFIPLQQEDDGSFAEFTLQEEQSTVFVLREIDAGRLRVCLSTTEEEEIFMQTVEYRRRWLSKCTYTGRWREMVRRSALTPEVADLRAYGAIVAALPWACPKASAESAIGTTATPGSGTQHSPSTVFCASGSQKRQRVHKLRDRAARGPKPTGRCTYVRDRRTPGPGRRDPGSPRRLPRLTPCRLGNGAYDQLQPISTASSWTPSTSTTSTAPPSPTTCGPTSGPRSTGLRQLAERGRSGSGRPGGRRNFVYPGPRAGSLSTGA